MADDGMHRRTRVAHGRLDRHAHHGGIAVRLRAIRLVAGCRVNRGQRESRVETTMAPAPAPELAPPNARNLENVRKTQGPASRAHSHKTTLRGGSDPHPCRGSRSPLAE